MAGVVKLSRAFGIALVALSLAACATTGGGYFAATSSTDTVALDAYAANAVFKIGSGDVFSAIFGRRPSGSG
jgi:hypothetical protein